MTSWVCSSTSLYPTPTPTPTRHRLPPSSKLTFTSSTPPIKKTHLHISPISASNNSSGKNKSEVVIDETEEEEVEEELPWIQEKALDIVEFSGSVTQALPGPRVGKSKLPWILAVPLAYFGVTFVIAVIKTVKKFNSPREKRKKLIVFALLFLDQFGNIYIGVKLLPWILAVPLAYFSVTFVIAVIKTVNKFNSPREKCRKLVNKNAELCRSIDELFEKGLDTVEPSAFKELIQKTGFETEDVLRKYIRYALNEKPFNGDLVNNLIKLRKASMLDDSQVVGILNDISRRIVKDKGPVVMDMSGYSEKGFKRKLAVQTLFGKIYYLSELPEFCSMDSSLTVKEIFGVADEDAEKLRLHTTSEVGDLDSLEKMVDDSDSEESIEESSSEAS